MEPSVAGPKRPQDRIALAGLKSAFTGLMDKAVADGGYGKGAAALHTGDTPIKHGDIAIAAITSCTNTSNPGVMLAAGLLAKKAVALGLKPPAHVKTSLGPGSRVVTEYLNKAGLMDALEQVGFSVVGYGCTTCIGNSGPLKPEIDKAIADHDLVVASVLSGNRNFEARVHQAVKANFLMSPPLVVAFALAGRVDIDFETEAARHRQGRQAGVPERPVAEQRRSRRRDEHRHRCRPPTARSTPTVGADNPLWDAVSAPTGTVYEWDAKSTYIQEPPFFAPAASRGQHLRSRAPARWRSSATRSPPTTSAPPAASSRPRPPACT